MAAAKKKDLPTTFGPSFPGDFPPEMRRQMWPLCCGASILSGLKSVNVLTDEELVEQLTHTVTVPRPDFQIFAGEHMKPHLTFLTLNSTQMGSKKIMDAIAKVGFVKIGEGKPRGSPQGFFLRDTGGTFTTEVIKNGKAA
jgi:hypothetical protein